MHKFRPNINLNLGLNTDRLQLVGYSFSHLLRPDFLCSPSFLISSSSSFCLSVLMFTSIPARPYSPSSPKVSVLCLFPWSWLERSQEFVMGGLMRWSAGGCAPAAGGQWGSGGEVAGGWGLIRAKLPRRRKQGSGAKLPAAGGKGAEFPALGDFYNFSAKITHSCFVGSVAERV